MQYAHLCQISFLPPVIGTAGRNSPKMAAGNAILKVVPFLSEDLKRHAAWLLSDLELDKSLQSATH